MKYILTVFYLTTSWPMPAEIKWAQLGPYETLLACESASRQAEQIVIHLGAKAAGSFCSQTRVR